MHCRLNDIRLHSTWPLAIASVVLWFFQPLSSPSPSPTRPHPSLQRQWASPFDHVYRVRRNHVHATCSYEQPTPAHPHTQHPTGAGWGRRISATPSSAGASRTPCVTTPFLSHWAAGGARTRGLDPFTALPRFPLPVSGRRPASSAVFVVASAPCLAGCPHFPPLASRAN